MYDWRVFRSLNNKLLSAPEVMGRQQQPAYVVQVL